MRIPWCISRVYIYTLCIRHVYIYSVYDIYYIMYLI